MVGIIALLISILLPGLSSARQAALRTSCAAKLSQQILAAQIHQSEHRGFYPLFGILPGAEPQDLEDPYCQKYAYLSYGFAGMARFISPLTICLATEMSDRSGIAATSNNESGPGSVGGAETDSHGFIKNFLCPAQASSVADLTQLPGLYICVPTELAIQSENESGSGYSEAMSYIYNEAALGWGEADIYKRAKGKLTQIHQPSLTMFAADGQGGATSSAPNRYETWFYPPLPMASLYNIATTPPVTMADAYAGNGSGIGVAGDKTKFDTFRHRGKINIAFFDGHVETRNITPADLQKVYLMAP